MRKNQYEEALFKCEDERFEIDMVIDSNMSTIRVLEPLAEELETLKIVETASNVAPASATVSNVAGGNNGTNNSGNATGGIIAPRFSFQLEKRHLSTVHLNAIARIYGEHGEEILELMRRNPAGTIPVVLKRLKQKDLEWRKARCELNKHWKDIVEKNHYRSFDHRSFYFRQQDKKYLSTRQLVNEITSLVTTDSSSSSGSSSAAVSIAADGTNNSTGKLSEEDSAAAGITYSVNADKSDLLAGMTPQLVLNYEKDAHLVHRDIYRILCHAAECSLPASSDKERLVALWRDLLRVFFNIPVHYLYPPSSSSASGTASLPSSTPVVAWTAETQVATSYGSGAVTGYRPEDGMYSVQLPFGVAHVTSGNIYGSEQLSASAKQVSLIKRHK